MENIKRVGMADLKTGVYPEILTTLGLGSCVGICLFDPIKKIIGMAHIMLPSITQSKNKTNLAKFADTAVERLIEDMIRLGACKDDIRAKLAGGAQMFSFTSKNDIMRIGERNVIASKHILKEKGIEIVAEDVGGNYGRTINLHSDNGVLTVKTIGHGIKEI